jgi:hypothetical protein
MEYANLVGRRPLLILSLALAVASLSTRWVVPRPPTNPFAFVPVSLLLTLAWSLLLVTSLRKHGRWGYWVLLGAPLAMYWPIIFAWAIYGCSFGNADCT